MDLHFGVIFPGFGIFIRILLIIRAIEYSKLVFLYITLIETIVSDITAIRAPLIRLCKTEFFLVDPVTVPINDIVPLTIGGDRLSSVAGHIIEIEIVILYISDLFSIR